MAVEVEFTNNAPIVIKEFNEQIRVALEKVGNLAVGYAQTELSKPKIHKRGDIRPNVDTGLLRNSITFAVGGERTAISSYTSNDGERTGEYSGNAPEDQKNEKSLYIGTNVYYAPYVEMGTSKTKAYPFIRPAVEGHTSQYRSIILDAMKG